MTTMTIIAIGTRGDVQPAVALGKALQRAGYRVRILASQNFADWIANHGLEPVPTHVNIQKIMESEGGKDWVERGHNPLVELRIMRKLLQQHGLEMAQAAWEACQGSDIIVSSFTSDVYAVGIAEKLGVKHISIALQPSMIATRNGRALINAPFPHHTNFINYLFGKLIIERGGWQLYGDITNRFRQEVLGLPPQTAAENTAARKKLLVLHGYSRHVVPHPQDWPENYYTVGYWFLDGELDWQPSPELTAFLAVDSKPVAIGFGSMTGRQAQQMTEMVVTAVQQVGCRVVLLSGWAGIGDMDLPDAILCLPSAPHAWLFPRVAAAVHHGGAGTTAAGLRAGIPSMLVPHFADQPFWGKRVAALSVGPEPILRPRLTADRLAQALAEALTNQEMQTRAQKLAAKIQKEDGLGTAVSLIQRHLGG